jgi:hypothetical protein
VTANHLPAALAASGVPPAEVSYALDLAAQLTAAHSQLVTLGLTVPDANRALADAILTAQQSGQTIGNALDRLLDAAARDIRGVRRAIPPR